MKTKKDNDDLEVKLCTATFFFFSPLVLNLATRVVEFTKARENNLLLVSRLSYLCEGF